MVVCVCVRARFVYRNGRPECVNVDCFRLLRCAFALRRTPLARSLAVQGARPRQEDRYDVQLHYGSDQAKSFFGVYDGHFGAKAAEFCRDNMAKHIISNADFDRDLANAVRRSVRSVDQAFLERALRRNDASGTTALCVVLVDRNLLVCNIGDCCMFAHHRGQLLPLTRVLLRARRLCVVVSIHLCLFVCYF